MNPESGFQQIPVAQVIIHPNYSQPRNLYNDICLLHLSNQLILSDETRTDAIRLPQEGYTTKGQAVVSGWGLTSQGGTPADDLMNVTVPVLTDDEW